MALAQLLTLSQTLYLALGQSYEFKTSQNQVWISNPTTLQAQILGQRALLTPKSEGLAYASGLEKFSGAQRIVILDEKNFQALKKCPKQILADTYPLMFVQGSNLTNCGFTALAFSESAPPSFDAAELRLKSKGYSFVAQSVDGRRRLRFLGAQPSSSVISSTLAELSPYYLIEPASIFKPGETIIFKVTLFEFSRKKALKLGLKVPQQLDGTLSTSQPFSLAAKEKLLGLGADFGESQGLCRILARPELRTKPGIAAKFQSGGEIPVKTRGLFGNTTIWKPYGLILNLTPLPNQKVGATEVSLDFKVEISEPDQSTAIDGIPGMIIRKLESRFDLRTDEDTLLSSMIQTRSGTMKSGIAGLFHVPLLGDLTSNHSNDEQQTELWFSIRPTWFDSTNTARVDQTL
jgi:hypothetical protein